MSVSLPENPRLVLHLSGKNIDKSFRSDHLCYLKNLCAKRHHSNPFSEMVGRRNEFECLIILLENFVELAGKKASKKTQDTK